MEDQRKILSWLSTDKPGWLNVYHDDSNVVSYRCFGSWENIELYKLGNGRVVGYVISFAGTHPYAWSREFIYPEVHTTIDELSINDETNDYLDVKGTKSFTIQCNSDEYDKLLYPKVVVDFTGINRNIYFPVDKKPDDNDDMIPNTIYTFPETVVLNEGTENETTEVQTKYYVNTGIKDVGRVYVKSIDGDTTAPSSEILEENPSGYFHIVDGRAHIIKQWVNESWKTITNVGTAVKMTANNTDVIVKGAALDEKIILDGTNKIISIESNLENKEPRIIGDDFNWEWLPLAYGDNNISITGDCAVQIRWIEPRKVGNV